MYNFYNCLTCSEKNSDKNIFDTFNFWRHCISCLSLHIFYLSLLFIYINIEYKCILFITIKLILYVYIKNLICNFRKFSYIFKSLKYILCDKLKLIVYNDLNITDSARFFQLKHGAYSTYHRKTESSNMSQSPCSYWNCMCLVRADTVFFHYCIYIHYDQSQTVWNNDNSKLSYCYIS